MSHLGPAATEASCDSKSSISPVTTEYWMENEQSSVQLQRLIHLTLGCTRSTGFSEHY